MLIDGLGRTSRYAEAVADDDDLARARARLPEAPARAPRLSEFGPTEELLAATVDRLAELTGAVVASAGGKPTRVRPWPRPVGASQRQAAHQRVLDHERVVSLWLPGAGRENDSDNN